MSFRLKLGPWLLIWAAIVAAQLWAVVQWVDTSLPLAIGVPVALQLLKLPFTIGRLNDLGRPPDDAILALVPFANLGLWGQLARGAPREELRQKRIEAWSGDIGSLQAFGLGARRFGAGFVPIMAVALPLGIVYAYGYNLADGYLDWSQSIDAGTAETAMQVLFGAAGLLLLYLLIQLTKWERTTRASWIPGLFMLPALLLGLVLMLRGNRDLGPAISSMAYSAYELSFRSVFGALFAILVLTVGARLAAGKGAAIDGVLGDARKLVRERGGDVIAIHGATLHAVLIGMQVIIPGVIYLLAYAFTDMTATFEPEKRSFARSSQLTARLRQRLFKIFWLGVLAYVIPVWTIVLAGLGPEQWVAGFLDPSAYPFWVHAVDGVAWWLVVALVKLSLYEVYRERVAREAAAVKPPVAPDLDNAFAPPVAE